MPAAFKTTRPSTAENPPACVSGPSPTNTAAAISIALGPLARTIALAAEPAAVDTAAIVSSVSNTP